MNQAAKQKLDRYVSLYNTLVRNNTKDELCNIFIKYGIPVDTSKKQMIIELIDKMADLLEEHPELGPVELDETYE